MSNPNISWFHCARCGSLFKSPAGESEDRTCTSCGASPSLGIQPPSKNSPAPLAALPVETPANPASPGGRKRSSGRKKRTTVLMVKLILGWSMFLVAIVLIGGWIWKEDHEETEPVALKQDPAVVVSDEDIALLEKATPVCSELFFKFLTVGTPEERNQFVLSPLRTAARMNRFYGFNALTQIDPQKLTFKGSGVVHFPGRNAIETRWSTSDGKLVEAVFAEENGEWRLDWEHFVRYSDAPWTLFLAGSDNPEGEFRVLARERLAEERKNDENISIVLYEPRFGITDDMGPQSPEFLVKRDSDNGRMLEEAFKLERAGKRAYNATLAGIDSKDLIRLRVKVTRTRNESSNSFAIKEVLAGDWYGSAESVSK